MTIAKRTIEIDGATAAALDIFLGAFDSIFTNDQRRLVVFLDSQISFLARLISVTHRDDIPAIPARRGRQPVTLVGGAGAAPEGSA